MPLKTHGRRALRRDDREDPVLLDQLARVGHRLLGLVAVVVIDGAHLAAVEAAAVVDDLEVEVHAELRRLLAGERQRPGEGVGAAQHDLAVADPLLGDRRLGGGGEQHEREETDGR